MRRFRVLVSAAALLLALTMTATPVAAQQYPPGPPQGVIQCVLSGLNGPIFQLPGRILQCVFGPGLGGPPGPGGGGPGGGGGFLGGLF